MREKFLIGRLAGFLGRPVPLVILFAQFFLLLAVAAHYRAGESSDGCLFCHADKARMERLGFPQFYMTAVQVERESGMPGVTCLDCHLGDGRAHDKDSAHRGMLKAILVDKHGGIIPRRGRLDSLLPARTDRMYALFPKVMDAGRPVPDPEIFTVLWHDRDEATLGYDPKLAMKTCGRKGCHTEEVEQFSRTVMGGNVRQRSMRHWTDLHGPNNCSPSYADMPPGAGAGFSFKNYELIKSEVSCPASFESATDRQRFCNVCHAGCLDCHYRPSAKEGVHSFTRRVPSTNCSGGGRGTGMCHSGTQERRRGDSYLGAEFSQPPGMSTDPHYKKGMECMDCHETGEKGMGDMQRQVDCSGCHYSICKAHDEGVHKKLRCQACHVEKLGGYEMTVWGRGEVAGKTSPFKKYGLYYGVTEPPILVKDAEGMYTPYKVWPNIATNMKNIASGGEGLKFRWKGGETRDAYAVLGTYSTLPGANRAMAWIQFDSVGHPLGRSRSCRSCHESETQKAHASWEYVGYAGSEPFTGGEDIVADEKGLSFKNIRATSKPKLMGDANLYDFAAWMYLGDIWRVKGDFSIPKADIRKYKTYEEQERLFKERLASLEARLKGLDKNSDACRDLAQRLKKLRGVGMHDPEAGLRMLPYALP